MQLSATKCKSDATQCNDGANNCTSVQSAATMWDKRRDRKSARGPAVAELWRGRLAQSIASGGSEPRPGTSPILSHILPIALHRPQDPRTRSAGVGGGAASN